MNDDKPNFPENVRIIDKILGAGVGIYHKLMPGRTDAKRIEPSDMPDPGFMAELDMIEIIDPQPDPVVVAADELLLERGDDLRSQIDDDLLPEPFPDDDWNDIFADTDVKPDINSNIRSAPTDASQILSTPHASNQDAVLEFLQEASNPGAIPRSRYVDLVDQLSEQSAMDARSDREDVLARRLRDSAADLRNSQRLLAQERVDRARERSAFEEEIKALKNYHRLELSDLDHTVINLQKDLASRNFLEKTRNENWLILRDFLNLNRRNGWSSTSGETAAGDRIAQLRRIGSSPEEPMSLRARRVIEEINALLWPEERLTSSEPEADIKCESALLRAMELAKQRDGLISAVASVRDSLDTRDWLYSEARDLVGEKAAMLAIQENQIMRKIIESINNGHPLLQARIQPEGIAVNFERAGYPATLEQAGRMTQAELLAISGVGPVTARKIRLQVTSTGLPCLIKLEEDMANALPYSGGNAPKDFLERVVPAELAWKVRFWNLDNYHRYGMVMKLKEISQNL